MNINVDKLNPEEFKWSKDISGNLGLYAPDGLNLLEAKEYLIKDIKTGDKIFNLIFWGPLIAFFLLKYTVFPSADLLAYCVVSFAVFIAIMITIGNDVHNQLKQKTLTLQELNKKINKFCMITQDSLELYLQQSNLRTIENKSKFNEQLLAVLNREVVPNEEIAQAEKVVLPRD